MPELVLNYPPKAARKVIKTAFETTDSIKKYHDSGSTIVGKTGMGLASYGEQIIVDLHESPDRTSQTRITIRSEREVTVNVTSNPQKYESAFLDNLNHLRGMDIEEIRGIAQKTLERNRGSKEVTSSSEFTSAGTKVGIVILLVILVFVFFQMMIFSSI